MLFKGNSSRLEFLIEKIQAHKESPSPLPEEKCSVKLKGKVLIYLNILFYMFCIHQNSQEKRSSTCRLPQEYHIIYGKHCF